ncbi:MAG TPA: TonB-dependent receptor, partial [Woeseiaceae bacterium]|nr:TonB-dependent receptor [Woeseiaceae bacterium]
MTRLSHLKSRVLAISLVALATALFSTQVYAQATTATIRIEIADESGNRLGGVPVTVTHLPTGRVITTSTNDSGIATLSGLAVGGPYDVNIPPGADYAADKVTDIVLQLDETEVVTLAARSATLEEIVVTAEMVAEELRVGVGRDFDRAKIDGTPSLARDFVSTLATEPKILVDNSVARGPAVSMAGQNFRFNSVTIDGVAQNDNFGLSKNASATQRTPISIDAIEAINVNIAPFDVTYGNFIGGNINIVTKSGTNDFEGSAYYFTTDDSLTGDKSDGVDLAIGDFSEDYYGFTFGGPIVQDKLFFFANYEKFETTRPSNTQSIDNIAGVTQADVDRARSILQTEYGFDPGPFATSDKDQDEKILLKLDWNINEDHRAAFTYQVADGDVLFDDFPEIAVLQSNRYNINEKLTAYSARLFSQWSDRFSTEFKFGIKEVENRQVSVDTTTPDFDIFTLAGGRIAAGGDRFRHTNELDNDSQLIKIKADY